MGLIECHVVFYYILVMLHLLVKTAPVGTSLSLARSSWQAEFSNSSVTFRLGTAHGLCGQRITRIPRARVHVAETFDLTASVRQRCSATRRTLSPWGRNSGFVSCATVRHIPLLVAPNRRTCPSCLSLQSEEGVATTMPASKKVSAADSRQKGQKACRMNACTYSSHKAAPNIAMTTSMKTVRARA